MHYKNQIKFNMNMKITMRTRREPYVVNVTEEREMLNKPRAQEFQMKVKVKIAVLYLIFLLRKQLL